MKNALVVLTAKGWHVTLRYGAQTKDTRFFAFGPTKKTKKAAEAEKDAFVKAWEEG